MPVDDVLLETEEKMEHALQFLATEYRKLRTGRASTGLVDHIKVDYYGSPTPLRQLANIGTPEASLIVIRPFDHSSLKEIEKAILASDLGITPSNDGKVIRLTIPSPREERRRQLVASAKELAEQAKVSMRNARHEGNHVLDHEKKDSVIPEDEMYRGKEEVQKLIDNYDKKVADLLEKKTTEIMEV
jgi:ribosome recycling factor